MSVDVVPSPGIDMTMNVTMSADMSADVGIDAVVHSLRISILSLGLFGSIHCLLS